MVMSVGYIIGNTVVEILPDEARPVEEYYNEFFASHCMELPDHVGVNWKYDPEFQNWVPSEQYLSMADKIRRSIDLL